MSKLAILSYRRAQVLGTKPWAAKTAWRAISMTSCGQRAGNHLVGTHLQPAHTCRSGQGRHAPNRSLHHSHTICLPLIDASSVGLPIIDTSCVGHDLLGHFKAYSLVHIAPDAHRICADGAHLHYSTYCSLRPRQTSAAHCTLVILQHDAEGPRVRVRECTTTCEHPVQN